MSATRRLAAILAADVAGYSRLIGKDEEGTLERLRSIRADVIDPKITEHRGRIVKTTGDGFLVEFSSVVDALRCATQWQHQMGERNADLPPTSRIESAQLNCPLSSTNRCANGFVVTLWCFVHLSQKCRLGRETAE